MEFIVIVLMQVALLFLKSLLGREEKIVTKIVVKWPCVKSACESVIFQIFDQLLCLLLHMNMWYVVRI